MFCQENCLLAFQNEPTLRNLNGENFIEKMIIGSKFKIFIVKAKRYDVIQQLKQER